MTKRKRSQTDASEPDVPLICQKFDGFVSALNELLLVTPAENFSTKACSSAQEDRAVIAKILKRMRTRNQLSWMNQYLVDDNAAAMSRPTDTAPSQEISITTSDLHNVIQQAPETSWPPVLPDIHDQELLRQAFTHRSYASACAPAQSTKSFLTRLHNERLEFLGDSFLNHSVTKMLYSHLPNAREGELSLFRAELIGNNVAASFARMYEFDKKLLLNDTAERDGVRKTPKVIADTFEAYLGALVLDGPDGVVRADTWLKQLMRPRVQEYLKEKSIEPIDTLAKQKVWNFYYKRYPTVAVGADGASRPVMSIKYEWVDGGGGNEGGFVVAAKLYDPISHIEGRELGRGFGLNKKEAEHRAAMDTLRKI